MFTIIYCFDNPLKNQTSPGYDVGMRFLCLCVCLCVYVCLYVCICSCVKYGVMPSKLIELYENMTKIKSE